MARVSRYPKIKPCAQHPDYIGAITYGFFKPWLNACPLCTLEHGKPCTVKIVDGRIIGPKDG